VTLEERVSYVLQLLDGLAVEVRVEPMGGQGGGVCKLKGKLLVFIDIDADIESQYAWALSALAKSSDLETMYILPEIRGDLERRGV